MVHADRCLFCSRSIEEHVSVPSLSATACRTCVTQLGTLLLRQDHRVASIWPALLHSTDEEGPEPTVRLPDGRVVELRQRTAELKEQLSLDKRAQLAGAYVSIGMYREAVLEAALVLSRGEDAEALSTALEVLLGPPLARESAVESVRVLLLPN